MGTASRTEPQSNAIITKVENYDYYGLFCEYGVSEKVLNNFDPSKFENNTAKVIQNFVR